MEEDGAPASVVENSDGSVDVVLEPDEPEIENLDHNSNLALHMSDSDLSNIATDLMQLVDGDKRSRKDWEKAYIEGLEYLGMKVEDRSEPWAGASGVYHPLMTEAVVRFQAQTMTEIFPASGPARAVIFGEQPTAMVKKAWRVEQELNYLLTEKMTEFRSETETMLFRLALAGSGFKKIWYDPNRKRPISVFVPAEDFVVPYGASDLESCERYAHIMRKSKNELRKLQVAGLYRDIDIPDSAPDVGQIEEAHNRLTGETQITENDDRHTLYEVHVDYDMPGQFSDPDGIALPYIITIDYRSGKVLSIYKNWEENDPDRKKIMHFVHYQYMPGMGFYGMGLIHLMGGLAKSATSILRQLIDSGTLSNLPGGLKTRGLRIKGDDRPIMPGEWRDVDIPGGQLKDSMFPLPYKEPSLVLYQLLGNVIEEGRRIGSIADLQVGQGSPNTPVGTTLALLERSLKVMSAVQARVHWALKAELRLISRIIREYMPPEYEYAVEEGANRQIDFDTPVDIIPVSDANASTMAQRVVRHQAAITLAQTAPHLYDMKMLHRQALESLDMPNIDKIIPIDEEIPPVDPATENSNILMGQPVMAHYHQDHKSHIKAHLAAINDPQIQQIVGMSPGAQGIMAAMNSHIMEHLSYGYRRQVEDALGTPLPDPTKALPPEMESALAMAVAKAAEKVKELNTAEKARELALEQAKDPMLQVQLADLEVKRDKLELERQKFEWTKLTDVDDSELAREKIQSDGALKIMQTEAQLEGQKMVQESQAKQSEAQRKHDGAKAVYTSETQKEIENARIRTAASKNQGKA